VARVFRGSAGTLAGAGLWWGDVMTEISGKDARGPDLVWRVPSLGAPAPSPAWDYGWGDVMTDNAGKDARGPDLVWRVPSLGAPAPSPAWDCGRGVMTEISGKDARGPDLVWRVPSLGAPAPSPAWDCGGVMWVDRHSYASPAPAGDGSCMAARHRLPAAVRR